MKHLVVFLIKKMSHTHPYQKQKRNR